MIGIVPAASSSPFLLLLRRPFRIPTNRCQTTDIPATSNGGRLESLKQSSNASNQPKTSKQSKQPSTSDPQDCQSPHQTEPDLLYLNILNDAVIENTESSRHHSTPSTLYCPRPENNFSPRNYLWTKLPKLDDIDSEYLVKKGVFDLPPPRHL